MICKRSGEAVASAKPIRRELWIDVRDLGDKGDGGLTDNGIPFEAATVARIGPASYRMPVSFTPSVLKPCADTKAIRAAHKTPRSAARASGPAVL